MKTCKLLLGQLVVQRILLNVKNGTKQRHGIAPVLFPIYFTRLLVYVFGDYSNAILFEFRTNDGFFNRLTISVKKRSYIQTNLHTRQTTWVPILCAITLIFCGQQGFKVRETFPILREKNQI